MRVLLLAEDCNPFLDSTPIVGYKACRAISNYAQVVLATPIKNASAISKVGCGQAEVVYIDNRYAWKPVYNFSRWLRRKAGWTSYVALAYFFNAAFELGVWNRFKEDLKRKRFDVVHRVTPMSPILASPLAGRSPVPFVIGPLNGGLKWPPQFRSELNREREWLTYVRSASRFFPYYHSTYRNSAAILAGFQHTISDIPVYANHKIVDFPEVGIDPDLFSKTNHHEKRDRLTFLFVGRFVPYKCPDVVLKAFAENSELRKHRLLMVGDGQDRPMLEDIVRKQKLENTVEFTGWRTQAEVGKLMQEADVFVFPSIRELGAGVVIEAMACSLPCCVVDYGAPGQLVGDCGVVIPIGSKDELVASFARELAALATDHERRLRYSEMSYERALTHFTWDAKARKIIEVYQWVLGLRENRPKFIDSF